MNIIQILRDKFESLRDMDSSIDSSSILLHIDRAYEYYTKGLEDSDDQYFTDVIYRCNQAFEGCSRLSYQLLAGKSDEELNKTKAYKIEDYLIKEKVLNDRVYPLFKNYRENWRNESAHNFRLFFSENEAFIAISNVTSYAYVLFNQMIIKVAHDLAVKESEKNKKAMLVKIAKRDSVISTIANKLLYYYEGEGNIDLESSRLNDDFRRPMENQFIGRLAAFIETTFDDVDVATEVKIGDTNYRGDLILTSNNFNLLVEVKSNKRKVNVADVLNNQISQYLTESNKIDGVLLILYDRIGRKSEPQQHETSMLLSKDRELPVFILEL